MPKISIIIAVYNVEKYLRQCLDSLVNQTLKDIEIICTDDGSTDNSLSILKEYQSKDSRIKIIEQENQGPGVARNNALDIATGKYIMIVDPDDWLEPDACELAYNQIDKNGNDLVIFDYKLYKENSGEIVEEQGHLLPYKDVKDSPNINVADLKTNFIQNALATIKIYNNEFLKKYSIRYLPIYLGEDLTFAILSLVFANNISILDKPLYIYRQHMASGSKNTKRYYEMIYAREYVAKKIIEKQINKVVIKAYTEYVSTSLKNWYVLFSKIDPAIKESFRKDMVHCLDILFDYMSIKTKFRYYMFNFRLQSLYYDIIRPIVKYSAVLPYRKIRNALRGKKYE